MSRLIFNRSLSSPHSPHSPHLYNYFIYLLVIVLCSGFTSRNLDSEGPRQGLVDLDSDNVVHGVDGGADGADGAARDAGVAGAAVGLAEAEEGDLGEAQALGIAEGAGDGERAAGVGELDVGGGALADAYAVVDVQGALGGAVAADGDDELERLRAQLRRRRSRLGAQREDDAAAQEERDVGPALARDGDARAAALDAPVRVPVVEGVVGQVDVDARGVLLGHGGDEQARAEEVLQLERRGAPVARVQEDDGVDGRGAVDALPVHGRVQVVEQAVADGDVLAGRGRRRGPAVQLLRDVAELVVHAVEGREGAEGGPAGAELLRRVAAEAADVGADHGHLVHGREGHHAAHREPVVVPVGDVVAEPVRDLLAGAAEGRARDDERPVRRAPRQHGVVRRLGHHAAEEVVHVVLGQPVLVDHVGVDRLVGDAAFGRVPAVEVRRLVVDRVLWI